MIVPERIKWDDLRELVEKFREECARDLAQVPVPIIELVEIDLKIDIIPLPGLLQEFDIDGFLGKYFKRLYIDEDIYFDERYQNRLRFTLAHEIGHLVLHKEMISTCKYDTPEDWIKARQSLDDEDLKWFELQAHEFGGRLLVPKQQLIREVAVDEAKINEYIEAMGTNNIDILAEYLSPRISKIFNVSESVIAIRLKREKILSGYIK